MYVGDDPVNVVDPSGKISCIAGAILTIIGLTSTALDGFFAGLGLFAVAAGEATLSASILIPWFVFPIVAIAGAILAADLIATCSGYSFSLFGL